jgi:hypothetical protein
MAESAVLLHFDSVGIVLLVLHGIVIPLLAVCASHCYLYPHPYIPPASINKKLNIIKKPP